MKKEQAAVKRVLLGVLFLFAVSSLGARELWLSLGSGVGILPGNFSTISLLNVDGTLGLGIHRMFNTPLRSDLEITYAGYLPTEESGELLQGMHGIQGVFLASYRLQLGKSFALTPRAGAGLQLLLISGAESQTGENTNRTGTQLLVQGGLAADFLLSDDWTLGLEGDYRLLAEAEGMHHGAVFKLVLNRKITDFSPKPDTPKPEKLRSEQAGTETAPEPVRRVDLSSLQGIDNIRAFQSGKRVTIILKDSFPPYEAALTERTEQQLHLIGEIFTDIDVRSAGFFGYVADVQEDEAELDKELSASRAKAVRDWLAAEGYLQQVEQTKAEGRSSNNPIADNSTAEGRAQNRRVEIIINLK